MALAANIVREMKGGWVIVYNEEVIDKLPLPIAGLMSDLDVHTLEKKITAMKIAARKQGVFDLIDPIMTLAFVSILVIPVLKLMTHGLLDESFCGLHFSNRYSIERIHSNDSMSEFKNEVASSGDKA